MSSEKQKETGVCRRAIESRKLTEEVPPENNAVAVPVEKKPEPLPTFWDGTPGTLNSGMVCRDGKMSTHVVQIIPCINGTLIIGLTNIDGAMHYVNVIKPARHPLCDVADEVERRKLWEYDQL